MFTTTDTIVAIATPPGHGGLGVVRVSGRDAHRIARELMGRSAALRPRRATVGRIVRDRSAASRPLDEVVVTWFEGPKSYTREDVIEIAAHGSPVLLRQIVELAIAAGARLAEPGEFTLRAHLNGRLDLIQAEAVADLVDAVTPLQARAAMDQLEGTLTTAIGIVESALFDLAACLEASLDFPDEGFHFITREEVAAQLAANQAALEALLRDGRGGRLLREGGMVVIAGRPNAGKSSLFNALVGASRAIVSEIPGTTRDVVTERVDLEGLPITLVDTAGLRAPDNAVEAEGVRRAREAQSVAALTILVFDGSLPFSEEDRQLTEVQGRSAIIVAGKSDLPALWRRGDVSARTLESIPVSATTGHGVPDLRRAIVAALSDREEWRDPPAISNVRHVGHVGDALEIITRVRTMAQSGATEEILLAELAPARSALEEITGRKSSEDLLRHIFGRFCIGK